MVKKFGLYPECALVRRCSESMCSRFSSGAFCAEELLIKLSVRETQG